MGLRESAIRRDTFPTSAPERGGRYYQLRFLWSKGAGRAETYVEKLRSVMASYGGKYERQFATNLTIANGVEKPDGITLAHFPTLQAFIAFQHDERLRAYSSLRDASFRTATIEGRCAIEGDLILQLRERQYWVEVARLSSDSQAYARYAKHAAPILARYGYRVEGVLRPEFTSGLPFAASVVRLACFDVLDGFERLQADPDFQELMTLYREATRGFMWTVGKLADTALKPSRYFSAEQWS